MFDRNYLNPTKDAVNLIGKGEKCIKLFHPLGNLTNPLWVICSPFMVTAYKFTPYYADIKDKLDAEAKRLGKSRGSLIWDIAYSLFAFGAAPSDYFNFDFADRTNTGRSKFVTEVGRFQIYRQFNDLSKYEVIDNKAKTAELLKKWYQREFIALEKEEDIPACVDFLNRYKDCILKPLYGALGRGVQKVTPEDLPDPTAFFKERLAESTWIMEERIIQGDFLADIHPSSVNTIRIYTVRSKKGNVRLFCPIIRMGKGGSIMDNYSSNGFTALVDPDTGYIIGHVSPLDLDNVSCHPDTGCRVIGQKLPQWEEAKAMAYELAHVFEDFRFIGWDLAYSKDHGWVLIEANCRPGIATWQVILKKGMKKELSELQKWIDEN